MKLVSILYGIKGVRRMIEIEWVVFFLLGAMAAYMGFLMGRS